MITAFSLTLVGMGLGLWVLAIFGPVKEYAVEDFVRIGMALLGSFMVIDGAWGLMRLYG